MWIHGFIFTWSLSGWRLHLSIQAMKTWTYLCNHAAERLSTLGTTSTISLYATVGRTWRLIHWSSRLKDWTPSDVDSRYTYRELLSCVGAQTGVGNGRLHSSWTEWGRVGSLLAACVPELLIHSWILGHIGRRRGVKCQAQDDDEERQQIQAGKLQQTDRFTTGKAVFTFLLSHYSSNLVLNIQNSVDGSSLEPQINNIWVAYTATVTYTHPVHSLSITEECRIL